MNKCTGEPAEQHLEAYVLGTLAEEDALRFEEHYFDCPECLARVEALQSVTARLRVEQPQAVKAPISWPIRFAAFGAIAATLLAGFLVLRAGQHLQPPAVSANPPVSTPQPQAAARPASNAVAQLADLALPGFQIANLRGESANPAFVAGMRAYAQQDCTHALGSLAKVPPADADARAALFFRGICQMHLGDLDAATRSLRAVSNAGDSPQQEAAFYFQAQIALARNDAALAEKSLQRTVALRGDYERRAQAELAHLRQSVGTQQQ